MGELVEHFLELGSGGTNKNDIACGTVHVGKTGATQIPNVTQLTEELGAVEFAGRLGNTHGVEMGHTGEHFGLVAVTADNAAAVTEDTHDATVFPVCLHVLVAQFKKAKQIFTAVLGNLIIQSVGGSCAMGGLLFDVRHNARPGALFELVQQRGLKFHYLTSTWFGQYHFGPSWD